MLSLLAAALLQTAVPIEVTSDPFPNDLSGKVGCATFVSGHVLKGDKRFGGLSSLRITGDDVTLVGDDAHLYRGRAVRDPDGYVTGFADIVREPLTDGKGQPLSKSRGDSESVLIESGSVLIALERNHRVARFRATPEGWRQGEALYRDDRAFLEKNKGFEAMERLADDRIAVLSEGTDKDGLGLVVFLTLEDGDWTAREARYRPARDFNVTEASLDPATGDLYVLERAFSRLKGPRARLVRVAAPDLYPGGVIEGDEIFRLSVLDGVDNMEGLQMERRGDGRLLAHLISDDNFNPLQKTVLMEFEIPEGACSFAAKGGDTGRAGTEALPQ